MSVRSPPEPTLRAWPLPLCVSVCPFRSSVTAFVTASVASPSVAVTSFASVTVPPRSSRTCSAFHGETVTDRVSVKVSPWWVTVAVPTMFVPSTMRVTVAGTCSESSPREQVNETEATARSAVQSHSGAPQACPSAAGTPAWTTVVVTPYSFAGGT